MLIEKKYSRLFWAFTVFLTACVTPFTPKGVESEEGSLVIEGDIIVNGDTKVYISLLRPLNSNSLVTYIKDASVWVENQYGEKNAGSLTIVANNSPYFLIDTKTLSFDQLYKLCVTFEGKQYESDFLTPFRTPNIDTIGFTVNETRTAVDFHVTTYGDDQSSMYYKWKYMEDWEVVSPYSTNIYYDTRTARLNRYLSETPMLYCWKQSISTTLIAKTDQLQKNIVNRQRLNTLYRGDDKISYLYSMELYQMSISKEAFSYWSVLKKNTDEVGGIFAPQPSELYGNIHCISNPEQRVLGYISAGTCIVKRIFATAQEIGIYVPYRCEPLDENDLVEMVPLPTITDYYNWGFRPVANFLEFEDIQWLPQNCVECTTRGTKNKPPFWPNDHI